MIDLFTVLLSLSLALTILFIVTVWIVTALADKIRILIKKSMLDVIEIREAALKVESNYE